MLHFSQFRQYLEQNGYDTSQMGILSDSDTESVESAAAVIREEVLDEKE